MKNGERPGSKIGHFTAADINDAITILAEIVRKINKSFSRTSFYTRNGKNYKEIKTVPRSANCNGYGWFWK
jgi:hypothetical protein